MWHDKYLNKHKIFLNRSKVVAVENYWTSQSDKFYFFIFDQALFFKMKNRIYKI